MVNCMECNEEHKIKVQFYKIVCPYCGVDIF